MPVDYKLYHPDWKKVIRPRILARDNHKCQFCQIDNYDLVERTYRGKKKLVKIILTIAHLDQNPQDWTVPDDRLAALCQRCHLNYDREHNKIRKKYGRKFKDKQYTLFEVLESYESTRSA